MWQTPLLQHSHLSYLLETQKISRKNPANTSGSLFTAILENPKAPRILLLRQLLLVNKRVE